MAISAYVLLTVQPASTDIARQRLAKLKRAVVREVLGPYDFIIELEQDTQAELTRVIRTIRAITGVSSSTTCIWIDAGLGGAGGGQ